MAAASSSSAPTARWVGRAGAWLRLQWVPVVLAVFALLVTGGAIASHTHAMSPIDEWVYLDYLEKVPAQLLVHEGEPLTQTALGYMACDGQVTQGIITTLTCGGPYDRMDFPGHGITTAQSYTPLFFVPTSLVGYALHLATGMDAVAAWRLATAGWLVAGLLMLLALLRRLGVPRLAQLAVGAVIIGSPFTYWTYTYVSTDAPALFFTALLMYLTVRVMRGEKSGWWIVLAGVLAVAAKVTLILAVLLVAVVLIVEWIIRTREREDRSVSGARATFSPAALRLPAWGVGTLVAAAICEYGWLKLVSLIAVSTEAVDQGVSSSLTVTELARLVVEFSPSALRFAIGVPGPLGFDALPVPFFASVPLTWLCIAGLLGSLMMLTARSANRALIIGTGIVAVVSGPFLAILLRLATGGYFTLTERYAAFMIPVFMTLVALMLRNRWMSWTLLGYGTALALCQPAASLLVRLHG